MKPESNFRRGRGAGHPPCISYKEACDLAGKGSLSQLLSIREDAPKKVISNNTNSSRTTWYPKPEMVAWIKKLKEEGVL